MMNQPTATVEITRPRTVSNVLRSYSVRIDGHEVGKLKAGETRRYAVPCGERRIEVALDFWRSAPLALTLRPGDTLALECGDQGPRTLSESFSLDGLKRTVGSLFSPSEYLFLRFVESAHAHPATPGQIQAPDPVRAATPAVPSSAQPLIFLSYRRQDSEFVTARIRDRLVQRFGETAIFRDYDSIPVGSRFRDHIRETISRSDVFLVVIGTDWIDVRDGEDRRRLDLPDDPVRFEIETALAADVPVVPVLVKQAPMPSKQALPASLASLSELNAMVIPPDPYFAAGMVRLIHAIEDLSAAARPTSHIPRPAFCTRCGNALDPGRRFCIHCGSRA